VLAAPLFDRAVLKRDLDGPGAIPGAQLVEHRGDVVRDGSLCDNQVTGNRAERQTGNEGDVESGEGSDSNRSRLANACWID
jgi:hypothetical protein